MKDYTKYDFAAIVGAEISVLLKSKVEYGGTLILVNKKSGAIFLLMNDNPLALEGRWFAIDEIILLSAKIKVEDMSVNQLKRFVKPSMNWSEVVMIAKDGVHHSILEMCCEPTDDEPVKSFTDYIDCTDWGWKHE